jgi:glycosyltransferase involved in cell wall biosynthesis
MNLFKSSVAVVSVINDLATDQRVQKTCMVLREAGYDVTLIGRKLPGSLRLPNLPFATERMELFFKSGPAFYFFFNLRLYFKLRSKKPVLLFANDLDTLLPNYRVAKSLKIPLIYDSHELFTEVPELMNNPKKKKIWEDLEKNIVPKLKHCITVNQSIADIFEKKYGVKFNVIRNIPDKVRNFKPMSKEDLRLPMDKKVILLQGAGINIDRGAEELVLAMKEVEGAILYIVGGGDVWGKLEDLVRKNELQKKVQLIKKLPKQDLMNYTCNSDLGISIDKNTNPNYYNSLPNKLFDYLQAGVPVLSSKLPEIEKILKQYNAGWFIDSHDPSHIASVINNILKSPELMEFRKNALKASEENDWEKEKEKYLDIIAEVKKASKRP